MAITFVNKPYCSDILFVAATLECAEKMNKKIKRKEGRTIIACIALALLII